MKNKTPKQPSTSSTKKLAKSEMAKKPVKDADIKHKKTAKGSGGLDDFPEPKKLGDGCVCFDLKDLRAKTAVALDTLSVTKSVDDGVGQTENGILIDFRKEGCSIKYIKSGAYACVDVDAKVFKPSSFVVDAGMFRAIKGSEQFVVFVINKEANAVEFRCGTTRGSVQLLSSAKDYLSQAPEPFQGSDVVLARGLVVDTFSKLMFNSFDPALPAVGLPLNIVSGKSSLTVTSNDNIVGALYKKQGVFDKFSACVPGQVFIKIVKNMPFDTVKCSFSENMFRVRCKGVDVMHPNTVYDLVDLLSWLEEDQKEKPDFELVLPTTEFVESIDAAMCMSAIDKSETSITIEFGEETGKVVFLGSNTQSRSTFQITKTVKRGKQQSITTNGKRILSFIALMRGFKEFRLRVSQGRAYLFAPDDSFIFLVPLT